MSPLCFLLLLPGEIDVLDSKVFSKALQESAVTATTRIVNTTMDRATGGVTGSGVIIKQSSAFVYVLTAGHLVRKGDDLEVAVYSTKSYPKPATIYRSGLVLAQSALPDLAVVRVATRDVMPGVRRLCPPRLVPEGKDLPGLTIGCKGGRAPDGVLVTVLGKRRVVKPGGRLASLCWETPEAPDKGRSGGPLLDRRGYVIGVASGVGDGKGYYTHAEEIHAFLKRSGLGWLSEEKNSAPGRSVD